MNLSKISSSQYNLQKCCCLVSRNYNSCNWPYRNAQGATYGPYTAQLFANNAGCWSRYTCYTLSVWNPKDHSMWVPISIKANVRTYLISCSKATLKRHWELKWWFDWVEVSVEGLDLVGGKCHASVINVSVPEWKEGPDMCKLLSAPHLLWQGLPPWQIQGIPWLCQTTVGKIDLGMLSKWHWGKIGGGIQPGRGEATTGCQLLVGPLYMAGQIHWDIGEQWDDAKGRQNLMS